MLSLGLMSHGPRAGAIATGSLTVQVIVDGEDRSGGVFWVVVLPADYPQPVVTEEIEQYRYPTERGRVRIEGLESGWYFVGIVLAQRLLKEQPPTSVEVVAPAWVQNSSGVTRGYWPAYKVQLTAAQPNATVTFVKAGDPPLPPGFVIPDTGGDNSKGPISPPDTGDAGLR
jgi:hypothetical protein